MNKLTVQNVHILEQWRGIIATTPVCHHVVHALNMSAVHIFIQIYEFKMWFYFSFKTQIQARKKVTIVYLMYMDGFAFQQIVFTQ